MKVVREWVGGSRSPSGARSAKNRSARVTPAPLYYISYIKFETVTHILTEVTLKGLGHSSYF